MATELVEINGVKMKYFGGKMEWRNPVAILAALAAIAAHPMDANGMGLRRSSGATEGIYQESSSAFLLEVVKNAPLFKKPVIRFTEDLRKIAYESKSPEGIVKIQNKNWKQIPQDKIYFDAEKQDFSSWKRERELSGGPAEVVGVVLGKIRLSSKYWGLLILESGFYSLTSVYLYPVSKEGNSLPGLQVADYFGDEGREIIISSKTSGVATSKTVAVSVQFIEHALEASGADAKQKIFEGQVIRDEKKLYSWFFDEKVGFVRRSTGKTDGSR